MVVSIRRTDRLVRHPPGRLGDPGRELLVWLDVHGRQWSASVAFGRPAHALTPWRSPDLGRRSHSGLPLVAAKPRAERPGSRVAVGHRAATRSALDAGRGVRTITRGEGGPAGARTL